MEKKFELTATDMIAIRDGANGYLTNKGATLYKEDTFSESVEYYRLAAAMGETHSISNLGYCYLYGRSIEPNTSLAIAYFTIAANQKDVDAAYKLGDIYGSDKWGVKDKELSIYYYSLAAELIIGNDWLRGENIIYQTQLQDFPSLAYAIARETFPGGSMSTNLKTSYQFLKHAEKGYEMALADGDTFYKDVYEGVKKMLKNEEYNIIREEIDKAFENYYDYEEDDD